MMPKTRGGIYHNLRESKYVISNSEVTFFFSSMFYLNKFMDGYKENRLKYGERFDKASKVDKFNTDTLADILFYEETEKRGFFVRLGRARITFDDLYSYALRKMTDKVSNEWVIVNGKQKTT